MLDMSGVASDCEYNLDRVVTQALSQDALSHHTSSSEENHLHENSLKSVVHSLSVLRAPIITLLTNIPYLLYSFCGMGGRVHRRVRGVVGRPFGGRTRGRGRLCD